MTKEQAMIHTLAKENDELKAEIGRLRQALEQQTSDDCVSRQAVLDKAWDVLYEGKYVQVVDVGDIQDLPPVTPTRKVGKWIEVWESQRDEFSGEYDEWREHKCSICDFQEMDADRINFCPNCGAEMVGAENE